MFTHDDLKEVRRVGCVFVIVALLVLVALGFLLGRCTKGYSITVQTTKEAQ